MKGIIEENGTGGKIIKYGGNVVWAFNTKFVTSDAMKKEICVAAELPIPEKYVPTNDDEDEIIAYFTGQKGTAKYRIRSIFEMGFMLGFSAGTRAIMDYEIETGKKLW